MTTKRAAPVCPMCNRPIREVLDVPTISVGTVLCVELRQQRSKAHPPVRQHRETQTPLERRLAGMLGSTDRDKENDEILSAGMQVAVGDAMRAYMADLRALSGETVASSALLPVWQPKPTTYWGAPPIPGSRPLKVAGAWKVGLVTRWRAVGLGARVDIKLVHQRRNYGQNVATLARVWVRCHLADVEGTK